MVSVDVFLTLTGEGWKVVVFCSSCGYRRFARDDNYCLPQIGLSLYRLNSGAGYAPIGGASVDQPPISNRSRHRHLANGHPSLPKRLLQAQAYQLEIHADRSTSSRWSTARPATSTLA